MASNDQSKEDPLYKLKDKTTTIENFVFCITLAEFRGR